MILRFFMLHYVLCLPTDRHSEVSVLLCTLSCGQDQVLAQDDSATETRGLCVLQQSLQTTGETSISRVTAITVFCQIKVNF